MKQRKLLSPGFKAQNGYIFTAQDCKKYNAIQDEINRFQDAGFPLRVGMIDASCVMFKQITGMK